MEMGKKNPFSVKPSLHIYVENTPTVQCATTENIRLEPASQAEAKSRCSATRFRTLPSCSHRWTSCRNNRLDIIFSFLLCDRCTCTICEIQNKVRMITVSVPKTKLLSAIVKFVSVIPHFHMFTIQMRNYGLSSLLCIFFLS